jgi:hypothetical protein
MLCIYFYFYCIAISYMCVGPICHIWEKNMQPLVFWTWLISFKMTFSSSIHLPANDKISLVFMTE